jgi:hypothetical protein
MRQARCCYKEAALVLRLSAGMAPPAVAQVLLCLWSPSCGLLCWCVRVSCSWLADVLLCHWHAAADVVATTWLSLSGCPHRVSFKLSSAATGY